MEKVYIEKLSDYIQFVESLDTSFSISRGQSKNFLLLPGALRKDDDGKQIYSNKKIKFFLDEFKVNSYQYMVNPGDINTEFEWMVYAQHYGLPTKLLDFSTSHMSSLIFSIEKAFDNKGDNNESIIYFLNPYKLNEQNNDSSKIINDFDAATLTVDGPVVIQGRKLNNRVNAQNGLFVYFKESYDELDKYDEDILKKVYIKPENKKKILASLFSIGVTYSSIYPELSYVTKDILMKENIRTYTEEEN